MIISGVVLNLLCVLNLVFSFTKNVGNITCQASTIISNWEIYLIK